MPCKSLLVRAALLASLAPLASCQGPMTGSALHNVAVGEVQVRRTAFNIPHIKASDWQGLGYGFGYAQSEDNLCTLADTFVTFRGQRSLHFGPDATLPASSSLGQPSNIDSDFFFRFVADDKIINNFKSRQPQELQDLVAGFAAGFNHYLDEVKSGADAQMHTACRNKPWLQEVEALDVYRRMYALNIAGGYARFITEIATATPPHEQSANANAPGAGPLLTQRAQSHFHFREQAEIGSNAIGFGGAATGSNHGLLLGNPHWYWQGHDRFYQAHLTIPGQLDVAGATLLGLPLIAIGYNNNVAWSHTVSTARRFGLFQLELNSGAPTSYRYDGEVVQMQPQVVAVDVKRQDGSVERVNRTLYRTHLGPMINLAGYSPELAWDNKKAFVVRDINTDNSRFFETYLKWSQARSLEEFIDNHRSLAGIPWLNTIAVGRNDKRAWYADIGAIPNVPDALMARCTPSPAGQIFEEFAPGVPVLDGSSSQCAWQTDSDSVQAGALGLSKMPSLLHEQYVANMNDSYWLTQPAQPLSGYPAIVGKERDEQSLRTRLGHLLIQEMLGEDAGADGQLATDGRLRELALNTRTFSAELFKDQLLAHVCKPDANPVLKASKERSDLTEQDLMRACQALKKWNNTGSAEARGAHIWDEFWLRVEDQPSTALFETPFDADAPLHTPRDLNAHLPAVTAAFLSAVESVKNSEFAYDAPRGNYLFATVAGEKIPLYGGCGRVGYFAIACSGQNIDEGGYPMDAGAFGNTYLQVVGFNDAGVEAYTILATGQSAESEPEQSGDYTRLYTRQAWLRAPFSEQEIQIDAELRVLTLRARLK